MSRNGCMIYVDVCRSSANRYVWEDQSLAVSTRFSHLHLHSSLTSTLCSEWVIFSLFFPLFLSLAHLDRLPPPSPVTKVSMYHLWVPNEAQGFPIASLSGYTGISSLEPRMHHMCRTCCVCVCVCVWVRMFLCARFYIALFVSVSPSTFLVKLGYINTCSTVSCFGFTVKRINCVYVCAQSFSRVWPFVTPWTKALQAPLCMAFPRQEYWSGLSRPSPEDLPDPGIEPAAPALAGKFFTVAPSVYMYPLSLGSFSYLPIPPLRSLQMLHFKLLQQKRTLPQE